MGEYFQNNAKPVTKEVFYGSYLLVVLRITKTLQTIYLHVIDFSLGKQII